jgi:sigma-E factor negative regulatory protein RseA
MNERKETISAFLDNNLSQDELKAYSMSDTAEDAKLAARYQLIGDALRDEVSEASFVDVSAAVRASIANENIADQHAAAAHRPAPVKPAEPLLERLFGGWFRPAAGLAVAASVAIVMVNVLSVNNTGEQSPGITVPVASVADKEPVPVVIQSNVASRLPVQQNAARVVPVNSRAGNGELDPYLNQHLDYATRDALQGRLPYVRSVSYEKRQ